jgi:hypothetical protein
VFDVTEGPEGLLVHIMDPNIPNPSKTTRVLGEDEFCQKWGEKVSDSLIVRRPAMAIEREVTVEGRQVVASTLRRGRSEDRYHFTVLGDGRKSYREVERDLPTLLKREGWSRVEVHDEMRDEHEDPDPSTHRWAASRVATAYMAAKEKETIVIRKEDLPKPRHGPEYVQQVLRRPGGGAHHTREHDVEKGHSRKPKHKKDWRGMDASKRVADRHLSDINHFPADR